MTETNPSHSRPSLYQHGTLTPFQRWRLIKDSLTQKFVVAGGLGVILAIVLIFFYLLYVVFPLFQSADAEQVARYAIPEPVAGKTVLLSLEEQNEVAVRFTDQAQAVFFNVHNGQVLKTERLSLPENLAISSFAAGNPAKGVVAYGLDNGQALVTRHHYKITYPNDQRKITPLIEYPLGQQPVKVDPQGQALIQLTVRSNEEQTTLVAMTEDHRLVISRFEREESLFSDEAEITETHRLLPINNPAVAYLRLDKEQRTLYLVTLDGHVQIFDVQRLAKLKQIEETALFDEPRQITALEFLNGELSLLVGDDSGQLGQWTLVRDTEGKSKLTRLRSFDVSDTAVVAINAEQRRKGFMTVDAQGQVGIFHSTANRELISQSVAKAVTALTQSPRANAFLLQDPQDQMYFWHVDNEHPDVSWDSIWNKVWYESYPEPDFVWQSSSSSNDFEPKMSLTPLVFGTLKAAFYAMLVAVPLSIMGAIYTAYFMAPAMRGYVKPGIELMGALPTVILGFLAGLWLAPFLEENLVSVFSLLLFVPIAVMLFAYGWHRLPQKFKSQVPEGWDAALLIPVIILASWLAFVCSPVVESFAFQGDLRLWLREYGISYDQRNSMVVGFAMGFAVIPSIFSIAEDAIFSVPKNLTVGSLALGATPWQTMIRVVLLTASPGIFSAIMIGLGRAVGETMIVLMATGNTPVMDLSIFQGMRTLSANIAVEMPESEVNSTHYRVLFLAALVLFLFTFVFNTLAEIIRQRLREKYSSL